MTRVPLRPLARILKVRAEGGNPETVERENLRQRHDALRDRARGRAETRLMVLGLAFLAAFGAIGFRMASVAAAEPTEPVAAATQAIQAARADIVDRNGRILATNLQTYSLYAQPHLMAEPRRAAAELARIFPELDAAALERDFTGSRKFLWLRRKLSPEQMQAVHDIGEPGLLFGPREMRLYPNGSLAAHVLGGTSFGAEGVHSAEIIGVAGVEMAFDAFLRDPANIGRPLELSLDLTLQAATREVLAGGMRLMRAKGAAAILMDLRTGEILAMVSLPDFDPNSRPPPPTEGEPSDHPIFNRALQGVYELGSTFKIFAAAQAMELGLVNAGTVIDARPPMTWGRFRITEFQNKNYGRVTVHDAIVKSSNIASARLGLMIGAERQQDFLRGLGFFDPSPVEMVEAPRARPLIPKTWSEIVTITASYGHGLSASPLHLAAAYAAIGNGGVWVPPTLLRRDIPPEGRRVMSKRTADAAVAMLRGVVTDGTASLGEVDGYLVAGKTGTAEKPRKGGGYHEDKVITTFASLFPANEPRYVLVVTLDEPVDTTGKEPRRTAGWTAVPVAAEVIRRVAPLLGLRPEIEPGPQAVLTRVAH